MALRISLLTLNVWGIPFISSDREDRMQAIGDYLAQGEYDFVSMQELWVENDFKLLQRITRKSLPYSHYFYNGAFGSGLAIFSKYPLISVFFHAWSVNGYVHRIQHGDWFGGKGVGLCRISIDNQIVNVYVTHLHAEYDKVNDEYKAHRVIQAFDTAQFIESTRNDAVLQILAGDLNIDPSDIAYKVILGASKMQDTCSDDEIGTFDCKRNSYADLSQIKNNPKGQRIDHIFVRAAPNFRVSVTDYGLPLPQRIPGRSFSFSDHEAVSVQLKVDKSPKLEDEEVFCEDTERHSPTKAALLECISICDESLKTLKMNRMMYVGMSAVLVLILFAVIDVVPPYGLKMVYLILKIIITSIFAYFLFMGTLWNTIEKNGVFSGKLSMEIALNHLEKRSELCFWILEGYLKKSSCE